MMSRFQPHPKWLHATRVLRLPPTAILGAAFLIGSPAMAQVLQTIEPQVRPAPAPAPAQAPLTVRTAATNATLQRDFDLLQAAYKGETWNVRALLAKGANIEVADGQNGFTPLMYAASNGHLGTVRYLLSRGAKVNARSREGVQMVLATGKPLSTQTIETQGELAQMNQVPMLICESGGITPLFLASAGGYNLTVRELLARGADVNARNPDGDTALMYAAFKGYLPSVEALLARGANVNAQDKYGHTALTHAAWLGHLPVVRALLNKGARVDVKVTNGWTPITYAQAGRHTAIVRLLQQAAARQPKVAPANRTTPVPAATTQPATTSPVPSAGSLADGSIIIVR